MKPKPHISFGPLPVELEALPLPGVGLNRWRVTIRGRLVTWSAAVAGLSRRWRRIPRLYREAPR